MIVDGTGTLVVQIGAATDLAFDAAVAGTGVISLLEDWLRPLFDRAALEPILDDWWPSVSGSFL